MKSVDELIKRARYRTKNSAYTYAPATGVYTAGISNELFLDYINDAQDRLQSILFQVNSSLFIEKAEINLVGNQQDYTIPDRVFGGTGIIAVQYNGNDNSIDYGRPLQRKDPRDRVSYVGFPSFYIPYSGKISVCPVPDTSSGRIRPEYYRELDDLDIRRGKVSGSPAANQLQLAITPAPDQYQIENSDFICISDRYGVVKLRNGLFSSYNAGTRTITFAANVSTYLISGVAVGDLTNCYVTCGEYTTTHSKLPYLCERYLRVYIQKRIMTSGDDTTSLEEDEELVRIENDILASYTSEDRDVKDIAILDDEIME